MAEYEKKFVRFLLKTGAVSFGIATGFALGIVGARSVPGD